MKKVMYILSNVLFLLSLMLLGKFKIDEQSFLLHKYQIVVTVFLIIGIFSFKERKISDVIFEKLQEFLVLLFIIPLWFWISGERQYDLYEPVTIIIHLFFLGVIMLIIRSSVKDIGSIAYYTHAFIPLIAVLLINLNCSVNCSVIVAVILPEFINVLFYLKRTRHVDVKYQKVLRSSRKKCFLQIGKDKYNFDRKEELIKYKYLCCAKLSRSEWKKCINMNMPYNYQDWKNDIENKYSIYNKSQLYDFIRYLELGIRNSSTIKQSVGIFLAAFASSSITILIEKFIEIVHAFDFNEIISLILTIMGNVLMLILCVGIIVRYIYMQTCDDELEQNLYRDYQDIIKQINTVNNLSNNAEK